MTVFHSGFHGDALVLTLHDAYDDSYELTDTLI
jgi:hypothetical protein